MLLPGWGGSIVEFSRLRYVLATGFRVAAEGAAGQVVAPPGALDALARLVDDPIEPLKPLAAYLVEAYGADNARVMAESWAQALRAIIDSGGDVSRSRAGLSPARPS